MSLARHFLREFRPFFRMLEEPLRTPSYFAMPSRAVFDDFGLNVGRPAVDVTEEGNKYVVEAELPGVKKENLDIRIGDGGRSVTIEGKTFARDKTAATPEAKEGTCSRSKSLCCLAWSSLISLGSTDVATATASNQISTERAFTGGATFSRTIWLPRPVDASNVKAKLQDGILSLTIPKAEEQGALKVPVE
jgi:HSP20 family molecular chaperone IbpA